VPYRVDISCPPANALDVLVEWGALDIEPAGEGLAAIIPDGVTQHALAEALPGAVVTVSAAVPRDGGSVWLLNPRPARAGSLVIAPPQGAAPPNALRLTDSSAFGSGHHPTTALCIEALEEVVMLDHPASVLDVGTGSGILALAALKLGVPRAVGLDIDSDALRAAADNARLNRLADRIRLVLGGPDVLEGQWPLIVANVLAAPLIEMAPVLVRRLGPTGRLILSGIPWSLESEVRQTYQHFGLRHLAAKTRGGWTALIAQASW
jgi:ribosomal protein L11 methyltransferase